MPNVEDDKEWHVQFTVITQADSEDDAIETARACIQQRKWEPDFVKEAT